MYFLDRSYEDRYLSQRGIPYAGRYLSQVSFKAADKHLAQECTQTDVDTVNQYLDVNFDNHLRCGSSKVSLRSDVWDLEARIKEQSGNFGDCTTILCVEDCPEFGNHGQIRDNIARVNRDINLIRLTLFKVRKGLSIDTFPLSTYHGKITVRRIRG